MSSMTTRRCVLLRHEEPSGAFHFDLLFEEANDCRTARLVGNPFEQTRTTGGWIAPHRKHYLTYEGPVSGDRGQVHRVAEGTFFLLQETPSRQVFSISLSQPGDAGTLILNTKDDQVEVEWLSQQATGGQS